MHDIWDLPLREAGFPADPDPEGQNRTTADRDLNLLADPHSFCFDSRGDDAGGDEDGKVGSENVIPFRPRNAEATHRARGSRR